MRAILLIVSAIYSISSAMTLEDSAKLWQKNGFNHATVEQISSKEWENEKTQFQFSLNLVVAAESGWTKKQILNHVDKIQKIYKACDLRADPVYVIHSEVPASLKTFSPPNDQEIAKNIPEVNRPVIFFMQGKDIPQAYGPDDFAPGSEDKFFTTPHGSVRS